MSIKILKITMIFFCYILIFQGCSEQNNNVELKKAKLSIAYIVNPRLPQLSESEIQQIIKKTSQLSLSRFSLQIEIESFETLSIQQWIDPYITEIMADNRVKNYMLKAENGSKKPLYNGFLESFRGMPLKEIIQAVKNQPNSQEIDLTQNKKEILWQLAELHLDKLIKIKAIQLADGKSLLQDDFYNEYMVWDYILEHQHQYDLVITNQLLASAEAYYPTVHSSMRGGITSGFAGRSQGKLGGTVVITTYPFISQANFFKKARGQSYNQQEIIEMIAFITLHEFGHLFKYSPHYYDHPSCVMRPTPGLFYKEWMIEVKKKPRCNKQHDEVFRDYFN